ncbi:uncharacterized protein LOC131472195 [Solea solea]|uniref:uncharacterized protein LOC131472195 n=1 Tax=Solea solea TaxID=90069 RepID=UPI00272ABF85|nr:uncharacterized protein LOC131472195 [Solea solea]
MSSSRQYLRHLITERLTAAAEEIFSAFERTIVDYEEEVNRQRKLLEIVCKPRVKLQRLELPQQHFCKEEEVLTEQQVWNQERNQEEPESGQSKDEQEEICTSHEGEQLEVKQEADSLMLTPGNEESDHMEPEPDSDHKEPEPDSNHQLLSHSSPVAESQDHTGSDHVEKNITEHEEDVDLQRRLFQMKWGPVIKLHRTGLYSQDVASVLLCSSPKPFW